MDLAVGDDEDGGEAARSIVEGGTFDGIEQPRFAGGGITGADRPHLDAVELRQRRGQPGFGVFGSGGALADLLAGRLVDDHQCHVGPR